MKKFRSILLVILSLLGCMLSVPIQAQSSLPSANLSPIHHIQHWSLQPQQQNDEDICRAPAGALQISTAK